MNMLRPDYERLRVRRREERPLDRIVAHYELERSLARELTASTREQRRTLYGDVYDRLFASLPDHPQWTITEAMRKRQTTVQLATIKPLLKPSTVLMEVGCGDAVLIKDAAPSVSQAIGVDVTNRLVGAREPANFRFLASDGITLPVEQETVDVVLSNHLIEHMHPDDVAPHLAEVLRVLKPGGRIICATPNRLNGPHDISVFFGHRAEGFHLREYDHRSLARTLRQNGFSHLRAVGMLKGRRYDLPLIAVGAVETILGSVAGRLHRLVPSFDLFYRVNQVMLVARK